MIVGATTVVIWGNNEQLTDLMYEIVPGFILCLVVALFVSLITYRRNEEIEKEFDEAMVLLKRDK
jgi:sodium/proline symporter